MSIKEAFGIKMGKGKYLKKGYTFELEAPASSHEEIVVFAYSFYNISVRDKVFGK